MKKIIISSLILTVMMSPMGVFARGMGTHPGCGPRPVPARFAPPPPRPAPHGPCWGGEWAAVGGVAYLTGSIIRACSEPTVVYTQPAVVYAEPRTVVVESIPAQTVVVNQQPSTVIVASSELYTSETLKNDLMLNLSNALPNIPFAVSVNSFQRIASNYSANITVQVAVNGGKYNITSGGSQTGYPNLRQYLTNEVINSVAKISNASAIATTTVISQ